MSRSHLWRAPILGGLLVFLQAAPAHAQFFGGWGYPGFSTRGFIPIPRNFFGGLQPLIPVQPLMGINRFNPLMFNPLSPYATPATNMTLLYGSLNRRYSGGGGGYSSFYSSLSPSRPSSFRGYMSGGASSSTKWQRNFARAQYQAKEKLQFGSRSSFAEKGAADRRMPSGTDGRKLAEGRLHAMKADTQAILSGEALNRILKAIIRHDKKQRVKSDFLTPELLSNLRFSGNASADAMNLFHVTGQLSLPAAFEQGKLASIRPVLEKDFNAVSDSILANKPIEPAKMVSLVATIEKLHGIVNGTIKDFDFGDATELRRFVNHLDSAMEVLHKPGGVKVFVPSWATEGTSAIELARHMAKYKLQFGKSPRSGEDSYLAIHRAFGDLLIGLVERNQAAKKR